MPKKRTAKDRARYYTSTQQRRSQIASTAAASQVKDVTTQLRELRIEQLRQSPPTMTTLDPRPQPVNVSPLGFTPANYTAAPYADPFDEPLSSPTSIPRARRIPGPAPPRSWLEPQRKARFQQPYRFRSRNEPNAPFPDLEMPSRQTLVHSSLLTLGAYFFHHQEYNKYNLSQLGIQLKQWLLTYIATRNIAGAITKEGLDVVFPRTAKDDDPEEMKQIVKFSREDEKHLRCLDLTDVLAGNLSVAQLRTFLSPNPSLSDEWQEPRFPNLTHLSLETSSIHATGIDPLKLVNVLSGQCLRLTHLNLAGVLLPSSGSCLYQLSKSLVCLEYIDLSRNVGLLDGYIETWGVDSRDRSSWDDEIGKEFDGPENHANRGPERRGLLVQRVSNRGDGTSTETGWTRVLDVLNWEGGWRRVNCLVAKKCGFRKEDERDMQERIFAKRGERGWIQVVLV
jgi:hypothetical protein